jgi:hypothetical protein
MAGGMAAGWRRDGGGMEAGWRRNGGGMVGEGWWTTTQVKQSRGNVNSCNVLQCLAAATLRFQPSRAVLTVTWSTSYNGGIPVPKRYLRNSSASQIGYHVVRKAHGRNSPAKIGNSERLLCPK